MTGHAVADCKKPFMKPLCSECNRLGHVKADCPLARRCLHCGEKGHIARDCPKKVAAKGAGKGRSVAPAGAKQSKKEDDEVTLMCHLYVVNQQPLSTVLFFILSIAELFL